MTNLVGPEAFYDKEVDDKLLMHHLKIKKGDVSRYVLLPGDPKRCTYIAQFLDNPVLVADYREYVTITGEYEGISVSVCSTGIGGPSASIAVEELIEVGADTLIRVGTSGALKLDVNIGDVVIAQGAIRDEGTSNQYITEDYPTKAHFDVIVALRDAAEKSSNKYHVGLVHSKDIFYAELEPENAFFCEHEIQKLNWYTKLGTLSSEMESAAIFAVGALRNVRTGAILEVVGQPMFERMNIKSKKKSSIDPIIKIALDAIVALAKQDMN